MTSNFMIFKITRDYQILVPPVANLLIFMIPRRYQPTPVYHALLSTIVCTCHGRASGPQLADGSRAASCAAARASLPRISLSKASGTKLTPAASRPGWSVPRTTSLAPFRPERVTEAIQAGHGSETIEPLSTYRSITRIRTPSRRRDRATRGRPACCRSSVVKVSAVSRE
jgi:hypothetical protein